MHSRSPHSWPPARGASADRPCRLRQRGGGPLGVGEDAELGELGRLHRRGRRRQLPDARGVHRSRPASTVNYDVAVDDNNTYYAQGARTSSRSARTSAPTPSASPTGWSPAGSAFGYAQELDHANIPNIANLNPGLQNPDFDPGRKQLAAVAGRLRRHLLEQGEACPGASSRSRTSGTPSSRAASACSARCATRWASSCSSRASTSPASWGDDRVHRGDRRVRASRSTSGQIRNIKGNSYLEDLKNEDTLAAICWSGDITVINAEAGDKWEFAIPDAGGTLWNDNFIDPDRLAAQGQRRDAHQLLLRARGRRRGRRLGELHHARSSARKEAAAEIDPELAENQLIFPNEETLSQAHIFRTLTGAEEQKYQRRVPGRPAGRLTMAGRDIRRSGRRSRARRDPRSASPDSPRSRTSTSPSPPDRSSPCSARRAAARRRRCASSPGSRSPTARPHPHRRQGRHRRPSRTSGRSTPCSRATRCSRT